MNTGTSSTAGSEEDSTLIDDLIRLHRRDPTFMTEKAMEANALVPYLAGLDTAAGMSAFTLFYVLRSPELRERARAEGRRPVRERNAPRLKTWSGWMSCPGSRRR